VWRKRAAGCRICKASQFAEKLRSNSTRDGAAIGPRQSELLAGLAVRHCGAAATFPTDLDPAISFVKINRPGQHQKGRRD
jgi:hypothetical protein